MRGVTFIDKAVYITSLKSFVTEGYWEEVKFINEHLFLWRKGRRFNSRWEWEEEMALECCHPDCFLPGLSWGRPVPSSSPYGAGKHTRRWRAVAHPGSHVQLQTAPYRAVLFIFRSITGMLSSHNLCQLMSGWYWLLYFSVFPSSLKGD